MTELLAPAGNPEKLKTALYFGADAVYAGGRDFSLRAFSENFTDEEFAEGVAYAHARGRKVYAAANIYARDADFPALERHLRFLEEAGADAVLVSDPGVFALARECAPRLPVHVSTQANTTNSAACRFWQRLGARRVVLARELSLAEIGKIHEACPDLELETFVHGAMCISYSGRCLLSSYLAGRDSNRGACVQACRWKYDLVPEGGKRALRLEEDARGSYILNSRDLNMLDHLAELQAAGVCAFKIEGRMKSRYYVASVVNAYRRVLDGAPAAAVRAELETCAHREFTTAYAFGENAETVSPANSQTKGTCVYTADVLEGGREPLVQMRGRFREGDTLEVLSPRADCGTSFEARNIRDEEETPVPDAKFVMQKLRISCPLELAAGDILRMRV